METTFLGSQGDDMGEEEGHLVLLPGVPGAVTQGPVSRTESCIGKAREHLSTRFELVES